MGHRLGCEVYLHLDSEDYYRLGAQNPAEYPFVLALGRIHSWCLKSRNIGGKMWIPCLTFFPPLDDPPNEPLGDPWLLNPYKIFISLEVPPLYFISINKCSMSTCRLGLCAHNVVYHKKPSISVEISIGIAKVLLSSKFECFLWGFKQIIEATTIGRYYLVLFRLPRDWSKPWREGCIEWLFVFKYNVSMTKDPRKTKRTRQPHSYTEQAYISAVFDKSENQKYA